MNVFDSMIPEEPNVAAERVEYPPPPSGWNRPKRFVDPPPSQVALFVKVSDTAGRWIGLGEKTPAPTPVRFPLSVYVRVPGPTPKAAPVPTAMPVTRVPC